MIDRKKAEELRFKGMSYEAIGEVYGVSRQRIHQFLTGYKPKNYRENQQKYKRHYRTTTRGILAHRLAQQRLRARVKGLVITHYGNGNMACVRCGFGDVRALTIDHINGGGSEHIKQLKMQRGGSHFYKWLIKSDYPVGYQTLCMNCQLIKRFENNEW